MGKYTIRTIRLAVNLFIVFFFASILYFSPSFLERPILFFENGAYDFQVRYDSLPEPEENRIVIIDIDDRSIDEIGHWTWPRKVMGRLVSSLFEKGAAVVGFDITFPDPERNAAEEVLQEMGPSFSGRAQLEADLDQFNGDLSFARGLSHGPSVLGFVLTNQGKDTGLLPPPVLTLTKIESDALFIDQRKHYLSNLPILQQSAKFGGFINSVRDSDGVIRNSPLLLRIGSSVYPSLALEISRVYLDLPEVQLILQNYGETSVLEGVRLKNRIIPTNPYGEILVPYRRAPFFFPHLSAADLLSNKIDELSLKGKIAIIGSSATSLGEFGATPVSSTFPLVDIHANIILSILDGIFPQRPAWGRGFEIFHILIVGLFCAFLLPVMGPITATLFAPSVTLLLLIANRYIWIKYQIFLPIVVPLFVLYIQFFFSLVTGLFFRSSHRPIFPK